MSKYVVDNIAGGAQPNLNLEQVGNFVLPLPSLAEQQKIADFLAAVDARIEALKQQKALLQEYKQGVMQRIFAQEIRFTDDHGQPFPDWEVKTLGEVLDYEQPTKYLVESTEYNDSYSIPVLTAGKTFILGYTNEDFGIYSKDLPVIIFDDFTTATQFVDFPFKAKSSAMKILTPLGDNNIRFIYEVMQNLGYVVGGHERHWISKFANLEIPVPSVAEQAKIAGFLSALDGRIATCDTQLAETQRWKAGLLQGVFV